MERRGRGASTVAVLAAFGAVYFIWGSTYLGIRFAIETIPPFTMAAWRFLSAGLVLFVWARLSGQEAPKKSHWASSLVVGALLVGSNGMLSWAEQYVASGTAALIVATVPLWMVGLEAVSPGGARPTRSTLIGLLLGLLGIAVLVGPADAMGTPTDPAGALVLVVASAGWAAGSIYSRRAPATASTLQNVGMQMLLGGTLLLGTSRVLGESVVLEQVSARSWLALVYLATAGGVVAYSAYVWLLRVSTTARVATYAYVNPVVAVGLGWIVAGESVTPRVAIAAVTVVSAVVVITTEKGRSR